MLAEHTLHSLEGLLTHVGSAECFITLPHPALQCGIVTAWWQSQVEGDTVMRHSRDERPVTMTAAAV
jgi:hypothetical protein